MKQLPFFTSQYEKIIEALSDFNEEKCIEEFNKNNEKYNIELTVNLFNRYFLKLKNGSIIYHVGNNKGDFHGKINNVICLIELIKIANILDEEKEEFLQKNGYFKNEWIY